MNFIVFTENGKPVFCSFGDEHQLASKIATFSILLNKAEISWKSPDEPIFFKNNDKTLVFLKKYQLRFILISLNDLPVFFLRQTLEIFAQWLIMHTSLHFQKILEKKSNYDLLA